MKPPQPGAKVTEKRTGDGIEQNLSRIQIIQSQTLKWLFDGVPIAVVASTTLLTFAGWYSKTGVDLLYLSAGLAIVISILFTRDLFEQFPKVLLMLWRRKILCPRQREAAAPHASPSQPARKMFLEVIQAIPERMNNYVGPIWGVLGVVVAGWLIWLLDTDVLQQVYLNLRTPFSWAVLVFLVRLAFLMAGFVAGTIAWRILVIADTVSKLGKLFDFDLQINHPDACGGLRPIGDLCLKLAYVISPFPILLGLWLVFINLLDIRFLRMAPENLGPLSSTIIFLTIPTAILCIFIFFLPLGSVHATMLRAKSRLQIELDSISQEIHQLSTSLLTRANDLAPQRGTSLEEKIEFLKRVYARNSQIPTWPYKSTHLWGLISTQVVPSLGVISSLVGIVRGFGK